MSEMLVPMHRSMQVKCYHRRSRAAEREVVFRVQFHTCTVHGAQLWFGKTELDLACTGIKTEAQWFLREYAD